MENLDKTQRIAIRNADKYFKKQLIIKYNLEPLTLKNNVIDWDYDSKKNGKTYQVYLHSLNFVNDLLLAGLTLKSAKYIKAARNIILNWYNHKSENNGKWNEHAVSTRIKNIIDFQEQEHIYKLPKRIFRKIVKEHCEFLYAEQNYRKNNHGLMMDTSLIYSCSVLEDEDLKSHYLDKALYRIRYAFYRDFSRKGVHLENSPEYHRLVMILYKRIVESLKRHNLKIDKDLKLIINNAKVYNQYIIKPNLTYPLIGDTGLITDLKEKKIYDDFVDYESGIAILNNEKQDSNKSSYITFKSGYQSKTHKHLDDLSITYYNNGHDILIDPGKYSYNKSDTIRNFLISPDAHNTISVADKTYVLKEPLIDQHRMKLTRFLKNKEVKILTGINNLYENIFLSRHVVYTNSEVLFLIDGLTLTSEEIIKQNFNINFNAIISKINELKYSIVIEGIEYVIETFPVRGQEVSSSIKKGYFSKKFGHYIENNRLVFETETKRTTMVTTVYRADHHDITKVSLSNNVLKFLDNESLNEIKI